MPREGHDLVNVASLAKQPIISIHVPREGHDPTRLYRKNIRFGISIHVPREGHDSDTIYEFFTSRLFQSTCPARGTTRRWQRVLRTAIISIHVPREGHD